MRSFLRSGVCIVLGIELARFSEGSSRAENSLHDGYSNQRAKATVWFVSGRRSAIDEVVMKAQWELREHRDLINDP